MKVNSNQSFLTIKDNNENYNEKQDYMMFKVKSDNDRYRINICI